MKNKKQFLGNLLLIVIFLPIAAFILFLLLKSGKDNHYEENTDFRVPIHLIDSVFADMDESERIGLLFFVQSEVNDSTDLELLYRVAEEFKMSSWLTDVISFGYHAQISDSLKRISRFPVNYAVSWDGFREETMKLPHFSALAAISDTTFTDHFADKFATMLSTYGVNSVVIPNVTNIPPALLNDRYYLKNIISIYKSFFFNRNFHPTNIIVDLKSENSEPENSQSVLLKNSLQYFLLKYTGYSYISDSIRYQFSHVLKMLRCKSEEDLMQFLYSPFNVMLIDLKDTEIIAKSLTDLYRKKDFKQAIDKKIKQVIEVRMLQILQSKPFQKGSTDVESSLWSTCLLQLSEHTACLRQNQDKSLPFTNLNARFIVARGCNIPEFHLQMKQVFPEYSYEIAENDIHSVTKILSETDRKKRPFVFIQNSGHNFQFDTLQLDSLSKNMKFILIRFDENPLHDDDLFFASVLTLSNATYWSQRTAAAVMTGSANVSGRIFTGLRKHPVIESGKYETIRLKQSFPEDAGLDGRLLYNTIDSLVFDAIARGAFPGCQIFAARYGKIIFNKAYGHHTYEKFQPVEKDDLYDVASVTKIAATTIAAMRMCDQGKLSLNETMKKYFKDTHINYSKIKPDTIVLTDTINLLKVNLEQLVKNKKLPKDTFRLNDSLLVVIDSIFSRATPLLNIFQVPIINMLMHYSGISPSLPILPFIQIRKYFLMEQGIDLSDPSAQTINWNEVRNIYYSTRKTDSSMVQVAGNIYLKNRWLDTLWQRTKEVGVSQRKFSQYSDLNMILVQMAIDTINKSTLEKFLQNEFYGPLGLKNIMFIPLVNGIAKKKIVPTENDISWRMQLLQGHVHDPSAAMLGGIAGNAGLFANANDVGILFQMLLNNGTYGGKRYLSENIIRTFTATYHETGRGLGFDKYSPKNIIAPTASKHTYGHTGFTGCCVWIDPEEQLVFVFLSNRIHPNVSNYKINTLQLRQKIHKVFYDAKALKE